LDEELFKKIQKIHSDLHAKFAEINSKLYK